MATRSSLAFAAVLLLCGVLFRTFVSGWGPPSEVPATEWTRYGVADYPADNLSYVSWAEQARHGRWLFDILYTTSAHDRLYFNPLFLAIGKIAGMTSASPLLVLNVLSIFSLPIVVVSMAAICRALGLGAAAAFAATCLAVGGAGISWVREAFGRLGVGDAFIGPAGPDLSFYDVYPLVAYFVAPYHALALALVVVLVLVIIRLDDDTRRPWRAMLSAGIVLTLVLALVRPHVSIMILAAYGAATLATVVLRLPGRLIRRRVMVSACLTAGALPPLLYAVWVTRHPVWLEYAQAHPSDTYDWASGFLVLWVFAATGLALLGRRVAGSPYAFLAAWAVGSAVLLIGLNGYLYPKLTFGFTIAAAALAGVVLDAHRHRLGSPMRVAIALAAVAIVAFASPLAMILKAAMRQGTAAPSELFEIMAGIRREAGHVFPAILADCDTGVLLPALSGSRVFCGHWALTDHNRRKIVLLAQLGFRPEGATVPVFENVGAADVASGAAALSAQLSAGAFEFLVLRKSYRVYDAVRHAAPGCTVADGRQYVLMRLCPEVSAVLMQGLVGLGAASPDPASAEARP